MKRKGIFTNDLAIGLAVFFILLLMGTYGKGYINDSFNTRAQTDIASLKTAIMSYKYEIKQYPNNLNELTIKQGVYGPWINSTLLDPWDHAYNYSHTASTFTVWSSGPNGANDNGGGDDIK